MLRFNFILLLIGFLSISSFAQNDVDAAQLLEKLSIKYQRYQTSILDVELIIDVPEIEESTVLISKVWLKGDQFKIEFDDKILMSNTISQWIYLKEVNELQISKYDPTAMIFLPSKLFNLYSAEYIYRIVEEFKNDKGELGKNVELSPVNKELEIFKIIASVNTKTLTLISTKMFEKSGFKYSYKINSLETNIKIEDAFFIFDTKAFNIDTDDITDLR
jgi:outer membrane lipoprotein carrier protein